MLGQLSPSSNSENSYQCDQSQGKYPQLNGVHHSYEKLNNLTGLDVFRCEEEHLHGERFSESIWETASQVHTPKSASWARSKSVLPILEAGEASLNDDHFWLRVELISSAEQLRAIKIGVGTCAKVKYLMVVCISALLLFFCCLVSLKLCQPYGCSCGRI
jgi:hypothetical protein